MTLDNSLGLNLYIISTVYHIVIILDNEEVRESVIRYLVDTWLCYNLSLRV